MLSYRCIVGEHLLSPLFSTCALNFLTHAYMLQACMPGVTVVLPIQGYRHYSLLNWQSQLGMQYAGPVEYLFVAQSASGTPALDGKLTNTE